MKTPDTDLELVLKALKEFGLLLETDARLPSVSSLVARETVRGSWWAHARSHEIFAVLQQVADHQDVAVTRLVSEKVTFVHRLLWPDLLSIAMSREKWQVEALPPEARMLLQMTDRHGELRSDTLEWPAKFKSMKTGQTVRELEKRLLIHSEEFHSESGAHAKLLETWEHWTERVRFKHKLVEVGEAKRKLEEQLSDLNKQFEAFARLPWIKTLKA